MQFCRPHWDELRDLVKAEGVYHWVARGGEAAVTNLAAEIEEGSHKDHFDPLMAAHNMIFENALSCLGLAVMGDVCPMCKLLETCPCGGKDECEVRDWPRRAVEAAKKYGVELGLVPLRVV